MSLLAVNFSKLSLVNWGPLSVTKTFGNPCITKIDLRCSIVIAELTGDICLTSSHLEYASITNKKVWPKKGPARSTSGTPMVHAAMDEGVQVLDCVWFVGTLHTTELSFLYQGQFQATRQKTWPDFHTISSPGDPREATLRQHYDH